MKTIKTILTILIISLITGNAYAFRHVSPYVYCAGDPVNQVDPDGKQAIAITIPGITNVPMLGTADPVLLGRTPVMANADKIVNITKTTTKTGTKSSTKAGIENASKTDPETLSKSGTDSGITKAPSNIDQKVLNQAKQLAKKGSCPEEIDRIDPPHPQPNAQWHAHGKKGGAINRDGSIKDSDPGFVKNTIKWLNKHGFHIPLK